MECQKKTTRLLTADAAGVGGGGGNFARGRAVAFPTETVYGLGADATDARAVAEIYRAKGRPSFNPLIAHVADLAQARRRRAFSTTARKSSRRPSGRGRSTLVLPLAGTRQRLRSGARRLDSVGLRIPAHQVAQKLLAAAGRPIAAPSANLSGHVSPATAAHVLADLDGRIDAVLDGGACPVGVESTIVALLDRHAAPAAPRRRFALRSGAGSGLRASRRRRGDSAKPLAPGLLASHYAPRAKLRLEAENLREGEAGLDFGGRFVGAGKILDLSPRSDLAEAAANLFTFLRALDAGGAEKIAVAPIPEDDLGEAINDRLRRAAAPRG